MSLCVQCGEPTFVGRDLCSHHDSGHGADWAMGNRIMCDFLHRGIVAAPRVQLFICRFQVASRERAR